MTTTGDIWRHGTLCKAFAGFPGYGLGLVSLSYRSNGVNSWACFPEGGLGFREGCHPRGER